MSGTATPSPSDGANEYSGPDDDLASGNITDADFTRDADEGQDSSGDHVTRPSPGRETRNQR